MSTLSSFSEHIARRFNNLRWNYMVVAVDRRSVKDPWWHQESTPTTAILLIAFNMVSAGLLMGTVFWVMCKASRKSNLRSKYNQSKSQLNIAATDALTLSFTVAVLIQGTILLVLQVLQMSPTISPRTCHTVKDILFPTLWIVGLVILVFGAETLYRGFKKTRFPPREKNVLYLCWAIIIILVLLSWIPTRVRRSTVMECKTSLLSTVDMLSDVAFGISVTFISLYTLMASVLTLQLLRSRDVNLMERIAATQMVYYMAIAAADFAFVVPFWARDALHIPQGITPMMAMVSINVIAIVMLFFQVLFRSSTEHMTIGYQESCRDGPKTQGLKRKISSPIPIRQEMTSTRSRTSRARDWTRYSGYSRRKNAIDTDKSLPPTPTMGLQNNNNGAANNKKSSYAYSIFPTKASARKPKHPASSIYEEDELLVPPRPAFAGAHNRNSSEVSHATVQIGLRLSNLADAQRGSSRDSMAPERTAAFAMHSGFLAPQSFLSRSNNNHISATSLDVPVTLLRSPDTERPDVTFPVSEPAASVAPPTDSDSGRLAPSTSRPGSSRDGGSGSGSGASPAVYKNLADLQKLLEVDLEAAQRAAAENETWPLRDPLPDLLPQKTYHPEEQ